MTDSAKNSKAGLKRRWRQHQKAHPFGLFTPVRSGPEATQELQGKLQRIADHIDPDLSPEAVDRLLEVLKACEGFQIKPKPGPKDQAQTKWETTRRHRVLMARLVEYGNGKMGDYSDVEDLENVQIQRMIDRQPELWAALQGNPRLCEEIIKAGSDDSTDQQKADAAQWADANPARPKPTKK